MRQRPLATRCDLLERYKWSHNVGRWEEGVASTSAAPPQRGPKLRASTVSGLGDDPGRAAGLVLDATWQLPYPEEPALNLLNTKLSIGTILTEV